MTTTLLRDRVESPVGTLSVVSDGERLCTLEFEDCEARMARLLERRFGPVSLCDADDPLGLSSALAGYLGGDLRALEGVPLRMGGTDFQERVWRALLEIPPGATSSYGALARRLGAEGASRAVGLANGANPIAIAVPCHRVIGADGRLTGYGGGIARKRWLLRHEGHDVGDDDRVRGASREQLPLDL